MMKYSGELIRIQRNPRALGSMLSKHTLFLQKEKANHQGKKKYVLQNGLYWERAGDF